MQPRSSGWGQGRAAVHAVPTGVRQQCMQLPPATALKRDKTMNRPLTRLFLPFCARSSSVRLRIGLGVRPCSRPASFQRVYKPYNNNNNNNRNNNNNK
eukprot:270811-Chlamydomonas_euryale.AAC.1